jgi:hypothetical protein
LRILSWLFVILVVCAAAAAAEAGTPVAEPTGTTRLTTRVASFRPGAIHDDFSDGSSQSFDLTVLDVIAPAPFAGRQLQIAHDSKPGPGSPWMAVGRELRIDVSARVFADPDALIPPAAIALLPDTPEREPVPFWSERDVAVTAASDRPAVRIGIWDSGVDTSLFPDQLARAADGALILRGYDPFKRRQDTAMAVLSPGLLQRRDELNGILQALDDRDSGVDSPAARDIAAKMKAQTPEEAIAFDDALGRWSGYVHGTAIADIALSGLPHAEIVIARQEWWHGSPPVPCWSRELADREAASIGDSLAFLVANGARVVNMSWGRAEPGYLRNLEECFPEMPEAERRELARYTVETIRGVLRQGMRDSPEVLFVGAAGNTGSTMTEANPATRFDAPNFIIVGAVDRKGVATDWTNIGDEVTLHADGERVASRLPGGALSYPSGTSMAVPLVVNAAAKMLTVNPDLSGTQMRELLEYTATTNTTGQRLLHHARAMEAAQALARKS